MAAMSSLNDIDNEEISFVHFDPFETHQPPFASSSMHRQISRHGAAALSMTSHDKTFTSEGPDAGNELSAQVVGKGKERTMPLPIRASVIIDDMFGVSPPSSSSIPTCEAFEGSSTSSNFLSTDFHNRYRHRNPSVDSMEQMELPGSQTLLPDSPSGKGKEKESCPYLPPLTFSVIKLDYHDDNLPSTPGSSSYGTLHSPPPATDNLPPISVSDNRQISIPPSPSLSAEPDTKDLFTSLTRRRSLSNLYQPLANVLTTSNPQPFGPSRTPSNLSRQLILGDNNNASPSSHPTEQSAGSSSAISKSDWLTIQRGPGSYPLSWYTVNKPLGPVLTPPVITTPRGSLSAKTRSKSSPYPISVLDFIPSTSSDVFQPLPNLVLNYFDLILPKELQLSILRALLESHENDHLRSIQEGRFSAVKASSSRNRWVGKDKGIRELFKLTRVSKSWQALVFDGELWSDVDLRTFHFLPPTQTVRLIQSAGTFIKTLNLSGHIKLNADGMSDITSSLCITTPQLALSYTQVTTVNFQGCVSLTTRSLHHFLVRSRALETLSLKGIPVVTNTTCDIIANFCPLLVSLNLSRCPNLDGHGIGALTVSAIFRKEHLLLKELRVSGLKFVTDSIMQALGRAAPYLEVLDLSYSRQLHNSALEAFVACEGYTDQQLAVNTVAVSPRDLGRETQDGSKLRRRVTRLRHLVLSFCVLLTDTACSNLAHSVPKLEFLELAGIGGDLKDGGLIRLLSTTPHIRRLDLEDAIDISDALLSTITPPPPEVPTANAAVTRTPVYKETGYNLEYLNVSYASKISDDAFLALIRNCPGLTVLEADNTRMGTAVLKEFIRLRWERKATNAKIVAVDCRGIHESQVKELSTMTRPRLGWRAYGARKLGYLDARDEADEEDGGLMKIGQDECDEKRVVLKTFYSWQTVDAVKAAREKRRKAMGGGSTRRRRTGSESSTLMYGDEFQELVVGRSRWWSPGGRRSPRSAGGAQQGNTPPILPDLNNEGCTTM